MFSYREFYTKKIFFDSVQTVGAGGTKGREGISTDGMHWTPMFTGPPTKKPPLGEGAIVLITV